MRQISAIDDLKWPLVSLGVRLGAIIGAAMIMPADPKVGDVYRPENIPGFVFEEVTVKAVKEKIAEGLQILANPPAPRPSVAAPTDRPTPRLHRDSGRSPNDAAAQHDRPDGQLTRRARAGRRHRSPRNAPPNQSVGSAPLPPTLIPWPTGSLTAV